MAKLLVEQDLPDVFTESMDDFITVENYIKKLEIENKILRMIIPDIDPLAEPPDDALIISPDDRD